MIPTARFAAGAVTLVAAAAVTLYVLGPTSGAGGPEPTTPTTAAPTAVATGSPSIAPTASTPAATIDMSDWVSYTSDRYGFQIGYPPDWEVWPADRDWSFGADATDFLSPAHEAFIAPERAVRVSAWSVPLDPGTSVKTSADIETWIETYCERTGNAPCTSIAERAVPLCLERRDCHPGLLVPFGEDVQAFFSGGIYDDGAMTVVAVWWGETQPAVAPYGGAQKLLEAFLSTMSVWPESLPVEERQIPVMSTPTR